MKRAMTRDEFARILDAGEPTAAELVAFVHSRAWRGWSFAGGGRGAGLVVPEGDADPLAAQIKRLLNELPCALAVIVELERLATAAPDQGNSGVSPREWLWQTGHRYTEDLRFPEPGAPAGAFWWRHAGEPGWRLVEERLTRELPSLELRHHVCTWSVPAMRAGLHMPHGERLQEA